MSVCSRSKNDGRCAVGVYHCLYVSDPTLVWYFVVLSLDLDQLAEIELSPCMLEYSWTWT